MALDHNIQRYGDELCMALRERAPVAPLTDRSPEISIEDACHVIGPGITNARVLAATE